MQKESLEDHERSG